MKKLFQIYCSTSSGNENPRENQGTGYLARDDVGGSSETSNTDLTDGKMERRVQNNAHEREATHEPITPETMNLRNTTNTIALEEELSTREPENTKASPEGRASKTETEKEIESCPVPVAEMIKKIIETWTANDENRNRDKEKPYLNYFDEFGNVDDNLLPIYLKGWKLNLNKISISMESMNKFIQQVLIDPAGMEEVFVTDKSPGLAKNFEIHVELNDPKPWFARIHSIPQEDRKELGDVIDNDLKKKVIEPSISDVCSAVILVRKRGNRNKVATYFKEFNAQTVVFPYPLPLLGDCIDCLSKAKFLSSLDIVGAYMSIEIPKKYRKYFAFVSHRGLFQWCRLPYGWKNSGSFFYKLMANTFAGLIYVVLCVYSDDTLMYGGETEEEHMAICHIAIQRCKETGLHLDITKCNFFATQMDYLGFQAVVGGIKPLSRNVDKLCNMIVKKVADIRSFLGLANFYRRFIKNFAIIAKPLHAFMQKHSKLPNPIPEDVRLSLDTLKGALTSYPILRSPDMVKRFYLATDGSRQGLGAVLMQKVDTILHPCAFASSLILETQKAFSSPMLEALASVWAMIHFKHYLRAEFTLLTDQIVLKWLKSKRGDLGAMSKWVLESQGFNYVVQHVPGRVHHGPDLMSRAGTRIAVVCDIVKEFENTEYSFASNTIGLCHADSASNVHASWVGQTPADVPRELCREEWISEQSKDLLLQKQMEANVFFQKQNDLWYFCKPNQRPRVVVPVTLRAKVLNCIHGMLGHRGAKPIVKWMRRILFWVSTPLAGETQKMSLRVFVVRWLRSCVDCNRRKMNPIPQPALIPAFMANRDYPMRKCGMDWLGRKMPLSAEGYQYLFTIMCFFSAYPIVLCLKTNDPRELGESLFANVFSIFGFIEAIHSDNDTRILSSALEYVFERFGVKMTKILPNHPEQNGKTERWHRYLNATLAIVLPSYVKWPQLVHVCALAYRALPQETTGFSPHFLVFGRDMLLPLEASLSLEKDVDLFAGDVTVDLDMGSMSATEKNAELKRRTFEFVDVTAQRLQAAFKLVRRSRFIASLKHQAKARKSLRIYFNVGDPVYYKRSCVANLRGKMRTSTFLGNVKEIPYKWNFVWSGPHVVCKLDKNPNKIVLWDAEEKCERVAHISDLRKHTPFSKDLFDTSCPTSGEPYTDAPEGLTVWSSENGVAYPKPGDICIARLLQYSPEDICVLKCLDNGTFQWFSNPISNSILHRKVKKFTSFELFQKTWFLPGFETDETLESYVEYREPRKGEKCAPFVAQGGEIIPNIFLWGVQFLKKNEDPPGTIGNFGTFKNNTLAWIEQEILRQNSLDGGSYVEESK